MRFHPFRHLGLKFLSICLAVLLWLTVAGEHIVERSLRVPLEFRNIPNHLELTGEPPATVDVRVRGPSGILSRLEPGEVVGVLDLSGARPGNRIFHVSPGQVKVPFGVEVAQVSPGTIALGLEPMGAKVVPITPVLEGQPAAGFGIGRISCEPGTVEVIGPESRLRELDAATTEPLSIEGAREAVVDTLAVGVLDPALRLKQPRNAVVSVEIVPVREEPQDPASELAAPEAARYNPDER